MSQFVRIGSLALDFSLVRSIQPREHEDGPAIHVHFADGTGYFFTLKGDLEGYHALEQFIARLPGLETVFPPHAS